MAIIKAENRFGEDSLSDKPLEKAKQITSNLTNNLQSFTEKIKESLVSIDTSDVEEINYCNAIIQLINELICKIKLNQPDLLNMVELETLSLTDEHGNIAIEEKEYCVSIITVESNFTSYYNTRIVSARSDKEAVYKYTKVMNCEYGLAQSLGLYDEKAEYINSIENTEVIV